MAQVGRNTSIGAAVLPGCCLAYALSAHCAHRLGDASGLPLTLLILAAPVFIAVAGFLIVPFLHRELMQYSRPQRGVWLMSAIASAVAVAWFLPAAEPVWRPRHKLEVIALGEKNEQARGSEVWVQLSGADGAAIPARQFKLEGDWEIRDEVFLSFRKQPARLRWTGRIESHANLRFASQAWSGKVEVVWDGLRQTIDLYSEQPRAYELPLDGITTAERVQARLAPLADVVSLALLVLLVSAWCLRHDGEEAPLTCQAAGARRWLGRLGYAGLFVALTAVSLPFTSRPLTWDELAYMGLGFAPEPQVYIMNRYAHGHLLGAFMCIFRDPYLATQIFWSASLAASVVALIWATTGLRAGLRIFVSVLFAFLLAGQDAFADFLGVAYSDYTLSLLFSISAALTLRHILRGDDFHPATAFALGFLLLWAFKSKEFGLTLAMLPLLFFLSPTGDWRLNRKVLQLLIAHLGGVAAGLVLLIHLNYWRMGDAFFGLRPEEWRVLFGNLRFPVAPPFTYLHWLMRPENFSAFLLYLLALVPLAATRRNPRLSGALLLPIAFLVLLLSISSTRVIARYTIPILPPMCFGGALAIALLLHDIAAGEFQRKAILAVGSILAAAGLAAIGFSRLDAIRYISPVKLSCLVLPVVLCGATALLALGISLRRRGRLPAVFLAFILLTAPNLFPAAWVAESLRTRRVRADGEARFRDLNALTEGLRIAPGTRFLLARNIYNGKLAVRRNAGRVILSMNVRQRLEREQVRWLDQLPGADELLGNELIIANRLEAEELTTRLTATPGLTAELLNGPEGNVSMIRVARAPATSSAPTE